MKKIAKPNVNFLKKVFYKGRLSGFKNLISVMVIVGMIFSCVYFVKYTYQESAASRAHIILNYPEIAESRYPDGSRFTYYDFVCEENLKKALDIMQQKGEYQNMTVDDIRSKFFIYSYLDGSATSSVQTARSEGNDFSYVANEYKITYVQPHNYKDPSFLRRFFPKNLSDEFLRILIDVNKEKVSSQHGGIHGFETISRRVSEVDYDYSEEVAIYKTRIKNIISYLKALERNNPDFVSEKHNVTLNDVKGKYSFLISNRLDGIESFVESSGISKDVSQTTNKINVNIEDNRLKFNKATSKAGINDYAMKNYDQTFTENLINVIQNKDYGLYQARPKTAFDTVSKQKYSADEKVAEYETNINLFSQELMIYQNIQTAPAESKRLNDKCEKLLSDFRSEYDKLTTDTVEVITEYFNATNENYVSSKVEKRGLISKGLIIKLGIVFLVGAVLSFIILVFVSSLKDKKKLDRKREQIKKIRETEKKGEV